MRVDKLIVLASIFFFTVSSAFAGTVDANDKNFQKEVIDTKGVVLVDFHATWCGPCKALSPEIKKLAEQYEGKAKVVKVDVDQAPNVSNEYKIQYIPHVVLFKDGKPVKVIKGRDAKSIGKDIDAVL